jgi:maleate cis-trans isomerase
MTNIVEPRYRYGIVGPTARTEMEAMDEKAETFLPPDIVRVANGIGISDYTSEGVEEAIGRYWPCVDDLVSRGAQDITLAGIPISSQLGFKRTRDILAETTKRTGLRADADVEGVIAGMHHLGVERIAIASRWADELNDKMVAYLEEGGLKVLAVTSEGQWAKEAFGMSIEMGVKLAFQLGREAMRRAPDADGLLLPGGTWRSMAAVPILEDDFGKPAFTNTNGRVWRLIHEGIAPPVQGWGRLLATP